MSMLIEKRNELVAKLSALETARKSEIEMKVAEYRAAIEAQYPTDNIDKVKAVIAALDEVISYDTMTTEPAQAEQAVQTVNPSPRPGMSAVFTPARS